MLRRTKKVMMRAMYGVKLMDKISLQKKNIKETIKLQNLNVRS